MEATRTRMLVAGVVLTGVCGLSAAHVWAATGSEPTRTTVTRTAEPSRVPETRQVRRQPLRVAYYGDSLAWEAQEHFVAALKAADGTKVRTATFGGTAICDWLDEMRADAVAFRPDAVVVEFSGNAFTPCMLDGAGAPLQGQAYRDRYVADAFAVLAVFEPTGAHVYFAGAPVTRNAAQRPDPRDRTINWVYRSVAAQHPDASEYVDAGDAVLDHGRYTDTLPCVPGEPCRTGGDNVVRAPDGGHFCPTGPDARQGVTATCGVWSSGAFRYGRAMAAPVLADLDA